MEIGFFLIIVAVAIVLASALAIASAGAKEREEEEARTRRRDQILAKYPDREIAARIIKKEVWVGETSEQVRDSLGPPVDIDANVLKTKKKEVWKYFHRGGNRFGLRLTLENDVLVGWDEKL